MIPRSYTNFPKTIALSFWSKLCKMQVVKNSEENGSNIFPSYCRQAKDTRLFASRPHLFNHLSHQIPTVRKSQ